jgi:hypothetical protein
VAYRVTTRARFRPTTPHSAPTDSLAQLPLPEPGRTIVAKSTALVAMLGMGSSTGDDRGVAHRHTLCSQPARGPPHTRAAPNTTPGTLGLQHPICWGSV